MESVIREGITEVDWGTADNEDSDVVGGGSMSVLDDRGDGRSVAGVLVEGEL